MQHIHITLTLRDDDTLTTIRNRGCPLCCFDHLMHGWSPLTMSFIILRHELQ